MPSDAPLAADEMSEQLMVIRRTIRSEDDGGSVDEKVSELSDYFKLNERRCGKLRLPGADGSDGVGLYTSDVGVGTVSLVNEPTERAMQ